MRAVSPWVKCLALWVVGIAVLLVVVRFLTATSSPPFPGPIGYNCGEVRSYGVGYVDDRDQAELCLWQHYQHCQSASLQWGVVSVDTGTSSMFAVQPQNGGCAVTYYTQDFSASVRIYHPINVYNCDGLRQQNGGLVAEGCGPRATSPFQAGRRSRWARSALSLGPTIRRAISSREMPVSGRRI